MFGRARTEMHAGYLLDKFPTELFGKVWYGLSTLLTTPVRLGMNSIPVPDTSVALARPPKIPRCQYTLHNIPSQITFSDILVIFSCLIFVFHLLAQLVRGLTVPLSAVSWAKPWSQTSPLLDTISKQGNELLTVDCVSYRNRNGAPSRKGCVVDHQMTEANNERVHRPPSQ